ncbi:hypothetical protein YT1_p10064 (plasmid) [Rhodococcus ruber]|nr:hypothetical protein YT1_p10064 [Rhodococcus ruber]
MPLDLADRVVDVDVDVDVGEGEVIRLGRRIGMRAVNPASRRAETASSCWR